MTHLIFMHYEEVKFRNELADLLRIQVEALEGEVFVGLTEEEQHQYDERAARIHELNEKISNPQSRA